MRLILFCVLLFMGIVTIFYLSWLPKPDLSFQWYIPNWLGRWTNAHDTLRTAIPFIFLGLLAGYWLNLTKRPLAWWLITWLMLMLVVIIAESGQLLLPARVFDWKDIAWGTIGAFTGLLIAAFVSAICRNGQHFLKRKQKI